MNTSNREPIAIIGTACRFPNNITNIEEYWEFLKNGGDAVSEIPKDRWDWRFHFDENPDKTGKAYVNRGSFLDTDIEAFDASFFDISPREASVLDPQQRLLLEVTFEALEDAIGNVNTLKGSGTGVYMGCFMQDNLGTQMGTGAKSHLTTHSAVSSTMTMISNRLSYAFDLQGPSFTLDTACSSSLVAVHQACRGLLAGDCNLAVAGGASLMFRPETTIMMCKGRFLASDGRSKTFSAHADGYGRGEGAGIVVLKRLADAISDGDTIHGVIMGSGVNQDGKTDGITVPSEVAQIKLAKHVYQEGGIDPASISYIEAHGTGTPVGDPIEMRAMGKAISESRNREHTPLVVGSVKAGIGHLEAAAGIAGLLKALLVAKNEEIPPQAWMDTELNPGIDFDALHLRIADKLQPLPKATNGDAYIAINSFGYGGTNAHAVIAKAPKSNKVKEEQKLTKSKRLSLYLSAQSEEACLAYAENYLTYFNKGSDVDIEKVCRDVANKTQLTHRWVISADSEDELKKNLALSIADHRDENITKDRTHKTQKPVFVFSGMGPQWWAMGHDLIKSEPLFSSKLNEADEIFKKIAGWSILDEMMKSEKDSRMHETEIAQPANFMIQMGLFELLKSWGVEPSAVVGHSVGEVSSGYASGSLSLEDALQIAYHRSRTQAKTAGTGCMVATALSEENAIELIESYEGKVSIAGINSATNTTLSGDEAILDKITAELEEKGIFARKLRVEVPYHSAGMDPILDELKSSLTMLLPKKPSIPLLSTVTGDEIVGPALDSNYWCENVRNPVFFQKAIDNLMDTGHDLFLEIGPHPVLSGYIKESIINNSSRGVCLNTLKRKENEDIRLRQTMASLWVEGVDVDFSSYLGEADRNAELPVYPWQRKKHWFEPLYNKQERQGWGEAHPLLGRRLADPIPTYQSELSQAIIPWLSGHNVGQSVVFPGAGYVDTLLAAMKEASIVSDKVLKNINFYKALLLTDAEDITLKTVITNEAHVEIFAGLGSKIDDWQLHASADLIIGAYSPPAENPLDALKLKEFETVSVSDLYTKFDKMGLDYQGDFKSIKALKKYKNSAIVDLQVAADTRHLIHPALLDGAFQAMLALVEGEANTAYLPVHLDDIRVYQSPENQCQAVLTIISHSSQSITADICLLVDGKVAVELNGIQCNAAQLTVNPTQTKLESVGYRYNWQLQHYDNHVASQRIAVIGENIPEGLGDGLAELGSEDVLLFDSIDLFATDNTAESFKQLVIFITTGTPEEAVEQSVAMVLSLQNLHKSSFTGEVVMVTHEAAASEIRQSLNNWTSSWVIGLRRSAHNELAPITFRHIDIDSSTDGASLALELSASNILDEVALINNERWALQLAKVNSNTYHELHTQLKKPFVSNGKNNLFLPTPFRKAIKSLAFIETDRKNPNKEQMEIEVASASLNYKDIAKVIGVLSEDLVKDTTAGLSLGLEVAGKVVKIGKGVVDYKVGDTVAVAVSTGEGFKRFITVNTNPHTKPYALIKPIPESCTAAESAASFVAYGTALWGLRDLAGIQKGETILIHGAAGGVGVAAVNVAKYFGAKIIASAGTPEKRQFLLDLGADYVVDSRSLNFGKDVKNITQGEGVDVVLNSVAGGVVSVSMDALAPFGRFIEIGKNDIFAGNQLNMKPFAKGISYIALDFEYLMEKKVQKFIDIIDDVWKGLEQGYFSPLPIVEFGADKVKDAFTYLMQSKQIGKVCIDITKTPDVSQYKPREATLNAEKCVIITGGLGGVGLLIANWCIDHGAKKLALLSRKGATTDKNKSDIKLLEERGTVVDIYACDATNSDALKSVFETVEKKWLIGGVVHAAGVLDDRSFLSMDENAVRKVADPKVIGASNLHQLTKENDALDFFWVLSSIASFSGNTNQVNYVLANSFMDGLIESRRINGLPGNSIQLGPVDGIGMATDNAELKKYLGMLGMELMGKEVMNGIFSRVMEWNIPISTMLLIKWDVWEFAEPKAAATFRFQKIISEEGSNNSNGSILETLERLPLAEKVQTVGYILAEHLAEILQMNSDEVDLEAPLDGFGIDSLTAVELQSLINRSLQSEVSILSMLGGKSILDISTDIVGSMNNNPTAIISSTEATKQENTANEVAA